MTDKAPTTEPPLRLDDDFYQNVEEIMGRSRRDSPVRAIAGSGPPAWLVTRYDDVRRVLSGPGFTTGPTAALTVVGPESDEAARIRATLAHPLMARYVFRSLLYLDPPEHTRLRRIVGGAFTPARVDLLRPRVEAVADEIVARLPRAGTVDLITEFAVHVPLTVISDLLGVPSGDRRQFFDWAVVINGGADPQRWEETMRTMTAYVGDLIADRRAAPGDDLLALLIEARDAQDRLTDDELIAMVLLLILAGHDTTVTQITNGVLALLRNPEALTAVRADPALMSQTVEELLRFDTPVNITTPRYTLEPVVLSGVEIPAGQKVLVSLLSANQDDARFPDAAAIDPHRPTTGHLAFGHGIHYCLGAPLARMETAVALQRLLAARPTMTLAGGPDALVYRATPLFHSLTALPVTFG